MYRLDFTLTGDAATTSSFTLNLEEKDQGEIMVGKNVPLSTATTGPRQDIGLKIRAFFEMRAEDVLVHVTTELSTFEGPSSIIRKSTATDEVLASPGKSALVTSIDDDRKHLQLVVVATRLR